MNTVLKKYLKVLLFLLIIHMSCASPAHKNYNNETTTSIKHITIYVVNNRLHSGILIPVTSESMLKINALKYFTDYEYADFGWGEEDVYQSPADTFCMDAKAILLINSSVVRVEGRNESLNSIINWSDFTVKFSLSLEQFILLCGFINESFFIDPANEPVITSRTSSGRVIFFRSVRKYYLFNTCNTWIADALKHSGIEISGSLIITSGRLYNAIKDHGTVLKPPY